MENKALSLTVLLAVLIMLGVGIAMLVNNLDRAESWERVDHCLVWGGSLDRASLMALCIDFKNEELRCSWQVQPDLSIVVIEGNETMRYACTKKVEAWQLINGNED